MSQNKNYVLLKKINISPSNVTPTEVNTYILPWLLNSTEREMGVRFKFIENTKKKLKMLSTIHLYFR